MAPIVLSTSRLCPGVHCGSRTYARVSITVYCATVLNPSYQTSHYITPTSCSPSQLASDTSTIIRLYKKASIVIHVVQLFRVVAACRKCQPASMAQVTMLSCSITKLMPWIVFIILHSCCHVITGAVDGQDNEVPITIRIGK